MMGKRARQGRRWRSARQIADGSGWRWQYVRWLMSALAVCVLALLGAALTAPQSAHANSQIALTIVLPQPASGVASGPVGANVAVTGIAAANAQVQLGYALQSTGCADGFTAIPAFAAVTADASGNLSAQFPWPDSASGVGNNYLVCAKSLSDQTAPIIASQQVYHVEASKAPRIELAVAGTPVAGATSYYAGGTVLVSGQNFYGYSGPVNLFLSTGQQFGTADNQPASALKVVGGSAIVSDAGTFAVTVQLPNEEGSALYLHAVSSDGTDTLLPSLVATHSIKIGAAPAAATATPTVTVTPTIQAPLPAATPPPSSGGGITPHRLVAIIGLGALSLLLFIVGIVLLASAAAAPRASR